MAAGAVDDVNKQKDNEGISYARKAMLLYGMALNTEGVWKEEQLSLQLQGLVAQYRGHFEGRVTTL